MRERALLQRVRAVCRDETDDRRLRRGVLEALRIDCDSFVWLLTDPLTGVGTAPLAEVEDLDRLPELVRLRYQVRPRWTSAEPGRPVHATAWASALAAYGVRDVLSMPFGDRFGLWGVLDLWRTGRAFDVADLDALTLVSETVTAALRRTQARALATLPTVRAVPDGPAVLVLSPDLVPRTQTAPTEIYLRALLPPEGGGPPIPAAAYNVAAQLLSVEMGVDARPPVARAHLAGGRWLTFEAARLGRDVNSDIAVTINPTEPRDRIRLFGRAHGLTERESEVLDCLADGDDTRGVAGRLHLSVLTVQDHLKGVFDKAGIRSRRSLL
ncbi:MAG: helix-turn-helix transcriptional regulator, partial [Nocardioides sp.]